MMTFNSKFFTKMFEDVNKTFVSAVKLSLLELAFFEHLVCVTKDCQGKLDKTFKSLNHKQVNHCWDILDA